MADQTRTAPGTDPFPTRPDLTVYGHACHPIGEDGENVLVVGHGRRARAAVNAWRRMRWPWYEAPFEIADRWVLVRSTCGCSEEQHRAHRREDGEDCYNTCSLLPCADPADPYTWAWQCTYVDPDTTGAITVTVAEW